MPSPDEAPPTPPVSPVLPDPDTALAVALMKPQPNQHVADRLPPVRISAYVLLGLISFSLLQTLILKQAALSILGSSTQTPALIDIPTMLGWFICAVGSIILLTTRRPLWAKAAIIAIGANIALFTLGGLIHGDLIGSAINVGCLWWAYQLYQSVDALA